MESISINDRLMYISPRSRYHGWIYIVTGMNATHYTLRVVDTQKSTHVSDIDRQYFPIRRIDLNDAIAAGIYVKQ